MFKKAKEFIKAKKEQRKHNYDLTFDNVAIPEVHTHQSEQSETEEPHPEPHPIEYDNVAIPEVHIRTKKK